MMMRDLDDKLRDRWLDRWNDNHIRAWFLLAVWAVQELVYLTEALRRREQ
jgi:hypothetical protein